MWLPQQRHLMGLQQVEILLHSQKGQMVEEHAHGGAHHVAGSCSWLEKADSGPSSTPWLLNMTGVTYSLSQTMVVPERASFHIKK